MKSFIFEHDGKKFIARTYLDHDQTPPESRNEGHGVVVSNPGNASRGSVYLGEGAYYDFEKSREKAKTENWGLSPEYVAKYSSNLMSQSEVYALAVELDFQFVNGFYDGKWQYVGVSVCQLAENGDIPEDKFNNALWGIESNSDFWREVAEELAGELK